LLTRIADCLHSRKGIALVVVMMVLAIALVLAVAVSFTIFTEIENTKRSTSTTQAFFAAEGGQELGRRLLDDIMETFSVPTITSTSNMNEYASMALSGGRTSDNDIGVLRDFVPDFDELLPRNEVVYSAELGTGQDQTTYDLVYEFTPTDVDYPDPADPSGAYVFYYDYTVTAVGRKPSSRLSGEQETRLTGSFEVSVFHPSFSFYNFFTVNMSTTSGQQIYFASDEMLAGPVYVGSKPGFAGNNAGGGPVFTDQFQTTWNSYDTSQLIYNPVVTWNEEYPPLWGVDAIPTPTNALSQARISMGDYAGAGDLNPLTNLERRENLGLLENTNNINAGVYYAKSDGTGDLGNNTNEALGGIYVYGNVTRMRMGQSGTHQYMAITQSAGTTSFDTNNTTGVTVVHKPDGSSATLDGDFNGLVFVDGTLYDLGGDSSYSSSLDEETQLTVAAKGTIYLDNHITYEVDPRDDPDTNNVLGLFSGENNVLVANDAPYNMTVHATIMATGNGKGFGVQDYASKSPSGDLNVLGGIIMNSYQAIGTFNQYGQVSGYRKNFVYDERFLNRSFAPPYFPVVQPYVGRLHSINRTDWGQVVPEPPE
jgi:hypothetical protein